MYKVENDIESQEYNNLQLRKIKKNEKLEILSISLEKGAIFPEHSSPTDAQLILLEGEIIFIIEEKPFHLSKYQNISFPKDVKHSVSANENSKFLIIR